MSRPRYRWWGYVKGIIQLYPGRLKELRRRQEARITPKYGPSASGASEPARTTEELGVVSLGRHVDIEMEAVRLALEDRARKPDGTARIRQIEMYHFRRTHTRDGASKAAGVSTAAGRRWNAEFIYTVARYRDLID